MVLNSRFFPTYLEIFGVLTAVTADEVLLLCCRRRHREDAAQTHTQHFWLISYENGREKFHYYCRP